MLLIKNGRVLDPASKTDTALDVLVDAETIKEVAPAGKIVAPQNAEVFDASGLIVAPGFIDLHAHLREPGQESSETIETGTRTAARGGFTAVCCMPNTKPVNDNASVTRFILDRAKAGGSVRVWPIGAASVGSKGKAIAEIAGMREAGIVAVSDDGKPIATAKIARYAGGGRDGLRSARRAACGVERGAVACGASFGEGVAGPGAVGEVARAAGELRSNAASFHANRRGRAVRFEIQDESAAGGAGRPGSAAGWVGGRNGGCDRDGSCAARARAKRCGIRSRAVWDSGIRNGAGAGAGTIGP